MHTLAIYTVTLELAEPALTDAGWNTLSDALQDSDMGAAIEEAVLTELERHLPKSLSAEGPVRVVVKEQG